MRLFETRGLLSGPAHTNRLTRKQKMGTAYIVAVADACKGHASMMVTHATRVTIVDASETKMDPTKQLRLYFYVAYSPILIDESLATCPCAPVCDLAIGHAWRAALRSAAQRQHGSHPRTHLVAECAPRRGYNLRVFYGGTCTPTE
jgi:hypothetical protein